MPHAGSKVRAFRHRSLLRHGRACPGHPRLSNPERPFRRRKCRKNVDGRDRPGHDKECRRCRELAPAARANALGSGRAIKTSVSTPENTNIVRLPGMDGTGELLAALADQLSAHRPVRLISYPTDRSLNYDQLVAYVRERLPDDPFVILGESFSGPIAIEIAATERRAVGLVLASSFARHPLPTSLSVLAGLLDLRWIPTSVVAAALMGSDATPKLKTHLRQVLAKLPREIVQKRVRDVLRVDKLSRLREIECPVFCLCGRSDRMVGKGTSPKSLPRSRPVACTGWMARTCFWQPTPASPPAK